MARWSLVDATHGPRLYVQVNVFAADSRRLPLGYGLAEQARDEGRSYRGNSQQTSPDLLALVALPASEDRRTGGAGMTGARRRHREPTGSTYATPRRGSPQHVHG